MSPYRWMDCPCWLHQSLTCSENLRQMFLTSCWLLIFTVCCSWVCFPLPPCCLFWYWKILEITKHRTFHDYRLKFCWLTLRAETSKSPVSYWGSTSDLFYHIWSLFSKCVCMCVLDSRDSSGWGWVSVSVPTEGRDLSVQLCCQHRLTGRPAN